MMKTPLAIVLTLALLLNLDVQARPAAHSGTAPSFRGGFTSQKSTAAIRMAPRPPAPAPTRYGSFGNADGNGAPKPPASAMSRDLTQKAASENALRTLDARRAAAAPPAMPAAAPAPATVPMPAPMQMPPVVVQQRSGMGDMVLGFMLGRAMSGSHAAPAPAPSTAEATAAAPSERGAAAPSASFGAGVLRAFLWLAVLGAAGAAVVFVVRRLKRARLARTPNYTFEGQ